MDARKRMDDGSTVRADVHGRPKGGKRGKLSNGMYYIEKDGHVFIYKSARGGELVSIQSSMEQAERFAQNNSGDIVRHTGKGQ